MSQRAESSSSASRPTRRQVGGGGGSCTVRARAYPVGKEIGLPLIQCPDCHLSRIIELRVKQDTPKKGRSFFKCPRNGLCGYYRFQKEYLDDLISKKIIMVMCEQLEEVEELGLTEDQEGIGSGQDEVMKVLEKMENHMQKMNTIIFFVAIVVFGMVVRYIVMS